MHCLEATLVEFFSICSVYKNSQILSLQLSSASCVSQFLIQILNKLLNTHVCLR